MQGNARHSIQIQRSNHLIIAKIIVWFLETVTSHLLPDSAPFIPVKYPVKVSAFLMGLHSVLFVLLISPLNFLLL